MRIYNKYIISLILSACFLNTLLAFLGQNDLIIYFIVNITVYLVITLLYVHFNPRARRALATTSVVLAGGFMVILAIKAVEILSG